MHIKRNKMPTTWPLPRKSKRKRYLAVPTHANSKGITVLYIIRDMLGLAETRKEAKIMILNGEIKVNNKVIREESYPVQVFGNLSLEKTNKHYRLEIVNQKFSLKEVSKKETEKKIVKIKGKIMLPNKTIQMNLDDGQNFISKEKFSVGDSVVVNNLERKVEKVLPLKEGAKVEIIAGKHAGERGTLIGIKALTRQKEYQIKLKDKEVNLPLKTLLVIE